MTAPKVEPASLQERLDALRERLAVLLHRISQSVSGMWSPRATHELYSFAAEQQALLSDYAAALERADLLIAELRNGVSCESLHHKKSEQHLMGQPCKVLARIDAATKEQP